MKAILITEMPNRCDKCQFYDKQGTCYAKQIGYRKLNLSKAKDEKCPLKQMQGKKTPYGSDFFNDYVNGWNDCIDSLLK